MPKLEHKKTLLNNRTLTEWHQAVVDSENWQVVATFALAEYASRGPTTDELKGAKSMLDLLTNLSDQTNPRKDDPGFNLKTTIPKLEQPTKL